MSKLYIGKNVMFSIEEVENQLIEIEAKIITFLQTYGPAISDYQQQV